MMSKEQSMKPEHRNKVGKRFRRALRNKRVQMALATLLVAIIVNLMPNLASVQSEILALITALLLAFIGDYTVRGAARIGHEHGQNGDEVDEDVWAETD
jgi:amino acid permease